MDLLLFGPEYRPNMSSMIRSAEFFGFKRIFIYDQNDLLKPPTNKKGRANMEHMARVWTAGAIEYIEIIIVTDVLSLLTQHNGRLIGTLVNEEAQHLNDFHFQADDLILFGSEKEGLPQEVIAKLDAAVYIPAIGQTNCLNVAVSFGVVVEKAVNYGKKQ